ncbi:hypothetical protein HDV03_000075 [Kappamyces sp. JEL0829]|nr:hypothetical protein HDV03_000075 [Kappamyces sp. JEL0829]
MIGQILASIALAQAAPSTAPLHQLQYVKKRDTEHPFYYPAVTTRDYPKPNPAFAPLPDSDAVALGKNQLLHDLSLSAEELEVTQFHRDASGTMHVYARRVLNGVPVDNQHAAIHIQNGQVVYMSSSIAASSASRAKSTAAPATPAISLDKAVAIATQALGLKRDSVPATKAYVQLPSSALALTHQFQLRDDEKHKWVQVSVDAHNGQIVQVVDYVNDLATYKVLALPKVAAPEGFVSANDNANPNASPQGWHSDGSSSYTDTQGNNIDSHIGSYRTSGGASLNFDTAWDAAQEPTAQVNKDAAIVNNFYLTNMMHDISYQYGFTEASGNFQQKNFGKGGKEGDRVTVNNQASGSNNANFATPPDGQKPTMNMFLWTFNTPKRDGSLENDVPMHEYTHGISNRLTGGSFQGNCLQTTEAGGMGEGWSDTLAIYWSRKPNENRNMDVVLGAYVYNNPAGIRSKPYSTDMTRNPYTFSYINTQNEVHAIGELWANTLWEMYWNLVDAYGWSANLFDAKQKEGNIVATQLVIGGLALQPCNPTFLSARDAILKADTNYYNGANKCLIWKAFAKRGMVITTTTTTTGPTPTPGSCAHDKCVTGIKLDATCDDCVSKIIAADSYCGTTSWDSYCVGEVKSVCGITC